MKKFVSAIAGIWLAVLSHLLFAFSVPEAPTFDAKAYVLMDFNSNKLLAQKDPDERIDPASLTKIMTMYVIDKEIKNGRISLEDEVLISDKAWRMEGSRMFVETGKKIKAKDLIRGIIIQSGNDSSVAMAEHVAGTEESFVELMNEAAKELGLKNTHFANATGIPNDNHYTSARDLAILAQAIIRDFPESYKLYSEKWFTYNDIKQPNRNRLLWRENFVDGIKTGHSSTADYCLAASGAQNGMRLIAIVVGSKSDNDRTDQAQRLLRYGFRFFETHKLYHIGQVIDSPRIWMGEKRNVNLGVPQDLYITIPQGEYANLDAKVNFGQKLEAPIQQGSVQGTLTVSLENKEITQTPVVALEEVQKGSLWSQLQDYVSLGIHKILKKEEESAT